LVERRDALPGACKCSLYVEAWQKEQRRCLAYAKHPPWWGGF
jgi:hypothetical protein